MNRSRLWAVCRLDLAHALRRPLFWIWALIVFFCAFGLSNGGVQIEAGDSSTGGKQAFVTSAFSYALELSLIGALFYTFFVAFAAGMELIRDREQRIEPLLHATPLTAGEYVWGRFLAAALASLGMLAVQVALGAFFKHVITAESDPDLVGAFSPLAVLQPALLFSVPLIVFTAGASFWIGERTRNSILVVLFPLVLLLASIFFFWTWTPAWLDPQVNRALMFVDPTGFRWLQQTWLEVDRGADFYNTALIGFDAPFYASRALMVMLGLVGVRSARRHLERTLRGKRVRERDVSRALAGGSGLGPTPAPQRIPLAELRMRTKRRLAPSSFLELLKIELRFLMGHPGVWLFLPLLVLNATFDAIYAVGAFDTPLLLTPGRTAVGSLNELTFTLCLLLMFFTVESLRRERTTGVGAIAFAAPVSTRVIILAKLVATSMLAIACVLPVLATCVVLIVVEETVTLDLQPYLVVYGLLLLPTALFWNALTAAVYAATRNRFATYAIAIGLMIWAGVEFALGDMSWTWNWSLVGALRWTDMGLFEMDRSALLMNRGMVLGAALFLVALTVRIFPRRGFDSTRVVLRLRPLPLLRTALVLLPWAALPIGLGIALQKEVNAGPGGVRAERWAKDYWRRNVRTWLDAPEPDLVGAEVELDLEPARRWLHSRGTLSLANVHSTPLPSVALTGAPHWEEVTWTLDGEGFEPDNRSGLYVFELPEPLPPGGRCDVGFDFQGVLLDGFSKNGEGSPEFILESGVVLTSFRPTFVPVVGFEESTGVDEDNSYDAREYPGDHYEGETPALFGPNAPHPVRVTVTAPEDYTMNSVGVLMSESVEDGRRTVTWESDEPVRFFNVVGGRWDVRRGERTAVFHHPEHAYNVDEMIAALDGALEHYSEWFHPFPWQELKLSEFPAYAGYAQGFPTNITFSESIGFLTQDNESSHTAFFVTAHEAAHQWWGNLVTPGEGPGGNLLSEGTAHFSTILLLEAVKGEHARQEFCRSIENEYNDERVVDSEREMVHVDGSRDGDQTVTYEKMGWVTWMLMQHMGRDNMLAGLRSFFDRYVTERDHPVLEDFTAHMRPFAPEPDAFDAFIDQWFHRVVLPEYVLEDVRTEPREGGGADVVFTVRNTGDATMPVEVAATRGARFPDAENEGDDEADAEPYEEARASVTLAADESAELRIACDFEPQLLLVDPDVLVLQRGRERALHRF
ncbi:MAG: M1 family aminopeptidase [Planctomycetota bacterium]